MADLWVFWWVKLWVVAKELHLAAYLVEVRAFLSVVRWECVKVALWANSRAVCLDNERLPSWHFCWLVGGLCTWS